MERLKKYRTSKFRNRSLGYLCVFIAATVCLGILFGREWMIGHSFGVASGIPYALVVALGYYITVRNAHYLLSFFITGLILIEAWMSMSGVLDWVDSINPLAEIALIWVLTILIAIAKNNEIKANKQNLDLASQADELEQKTKELDEKNNQLKSSEMALVDREERLQLVISAVSDGIWERPDLKADQEWWSPRFYELLGYDNCELEASLTTFKRLLYEDDKIHINKTVQNIIEKDRRFDVEYRLKTKNNGYRWFRGRGQVTCNRAGKPISMAGSIADIHEKKIADEKLRQSNSQLKKLNSLFLETQKFAQLGAWELKLNPMDLYWTEEVYNIHELKVNQDITLDEGIDFYHPDHREKIKNAVEAAIHDRDPYDLELKLITAKQNTIWVRAMGVPVIRHGKVHKIRGLFMNIDRTKQAEMSLLNLTKLLDEKVQVRTADLLRANKELESFSYSVSHDLRAPLRVIDGFATILNEDYADRLDIEGNEIISTIIGNVAKMSCLIDDILAFSRINRKDVVKVSIDTNVLISEVIGELHHRINTQKVQIHVAPNLPALFGDRSMLKQVFINLVGNAVKYSSSEPIAVIEIGNNLSEDGTTQMFVRDNGVGFNMKYYSKVFEVFQRLHRYEEFEGTGVGLAITKRILEKHDGHIWAESQEKVGAVFYVSLPEKIEEAEPVLI